MKLKAFLYMLLRDELTVGTCEAMMQEIAKIPEQGAAFTNQPLERYVETVIERLK